MKGKSLFVAVAGVLLLVCCNAETESPVAPTALHETLEIPMPPADSGTPVTCSRYVDRDGDDANPGSESRPWATWHQAAEMAEPGDTVCFRGGIYHTEGVHLIRSGTAERPITFAAYPGEVPILDGESRASELVTLEAGVSYLRISGFVLQNFSIWGIWLAGENRSIQLDHLDVGGGETGIRFTYGDSEGEAEEGPVEYVILEDSVIHDTVYSAVDCTPGPCNHLVLRRLQVHDTGRGRDASFGADGIEIARGRPIVVEDCAVYDNGGDGIDLNSRDRAGRVSGILVRGNEVARNRLQGIKLWAGGLMENNYIWGQGINPVVVGIYTGTYTVTNNTIAYNMWDPTFGGRDYAFVAAYPEIGFSPRVTLTMINNIFAFNADPMDGGPTGLYFGAGVHLVEHHNLFYSRADAEITAEFVRERDPDFAREEIADGSWTLWTGCGEGTITADPRFSSPWPDVDLALADDSPALNTGTGSCGQIGACEQD
jgi:hypothetical protein